MVEDERKTAGWQSWTNVRTLAANRSGWKENVKTLLPYGIKRYRIGRNKNGLLEKIDTDYKR